VFEKTPKGRSDNSRVAGTLTEEKRGSVCPWRRENEHLIGKIVRKVLSFMDGDVLRKSVHS